MELYIADKELRSNILQDNPMPDNIDPVKKLDDFAVAMYSERETERFRHELINHDKVFEKIQTKIREIMGPLCCLWDMVEGATNSGKDTTSVSLDDMQKYM